MMFRQNKAKQVGNVLQRDYGDIRMRLFGHPSSGRPEPDHQYFYEKPFSDGLLGIVVPMYNESSEPLRRTLISIHEQMQHITRKDRQTFLPHVLLILDGWTTDSEEQQITHRTMKGYLHAMFSAGGGAGTGWVDELEDPTSKGTPRFQTVILQRISRLGFVEPVNVNIGVEEDGSIIPMAESVNMLVTLIIKRDNRKKHNSHEWFLGESGFGNYYRPEYLFATDCGTLFDRDCLRKLITHMQKNPDLAVVTGRQRVMSKEQQGTPEESFFSIDSLLRHAQMYDYESSFACYMGTFALVGFLPVIPGPCGLYRTEMLLPGGGYVDSPCHWYFDVVNKDPDMSGLVLGNLRIAEDRVLSYASVIKAHVPARMGLVPEAIFYFEAETSLQMLALQRRRWINGTWAGYWYLAVQNPGLLFRHPYISVVRALLIWLLLLCQLMIYFVVGLSPAIFLGAMRLTLLIITPASIGELLPNGVWLIFVLLYVYFVLHHHKNKYEMWMFNIWMLFSAVLSLSSVISFVTYLSKHKELMDPHLLLKWDFGNLDFTNALACWIIVLVFVVPLVLSLLHSPSSFVLMLRSLVPYYLFLPMIVGFFGAYSFARCWDLSWGNRPAGNVLTHKMKEEQEQKLKGMAATICAFLVVLNCIFFLLQASALAQIGGMLYLAAALFATTLIQMGVGLIWFIGYDLRRIKYFIATRLLWFAFHHQPPECCWWFLGLHKSQYDEIKEEKLPLTKVTVDIFEGREHSAVPRDSYLPNKAANPRSPSSLQSSVPRAQQTRTSTAPLPPHQLNRANSTSLPQPRRQSKDERQTKDLLRESDPVPQTPTWDEHMWEEQQWEGQAWEGHAGVWPGNGQHGGMDGMDNVNGMEELYGGMDNHMHRFEREHGGMDNMNGMERENGGIDMNELRRPSNQLSP